MSQSQIRSFLPAWIEFPNSPGAGIGTHVKRDPRDILTWGDECGRGFQTFKDSSGTHITKGSRKSYRGMSSDSDRVR